MMLYKIRFSQYTLLLILLMLLGCEREVTIPIEPDKPVGIPATSIWVGGMGGGVFVLITKPNTSEKDIYYAEIYYRSGDTAYKGSMRIFPANSSFDPTKKERYTGWDGDNIYLTNKQYLKVQQ